ncbi:late histone H2B.L4-like [Carcharodon carcharias]|uniref:late histone H2B.L4-like n=1 Tax=Carcharodon carcharias TaxID=13397 RepID=UPI001B7F5A60|nr:late histone H2B.L4-like [Carcharodon carcharias]
MPEVAAAVKGSASHKVSKQLLTKVTKKWRKSRKQSYSTYVYRVLTQVRSSIRVSSKVMSVMNSFVVDIFERIFSKASHLIHYKCHTISAREIWSTVRHMLPGELAKHTASKGMKAVTKYTDSIWVDHSKDYIKINTLQHMYMGLGVSSQ